MPNKLQVLHLTDSFPACAFQCKIRSLRVKRLLAKNQFIVTRHLVFLKSLKCRKLALRCYHDVFFVLAPFSLKDITLTQWSIGTALDMIISSTYTTYFFHTYFFLFQGCPKFSFLQPPVQASNAYAPRALRPHIDGLCKQVSDVPGNMISEFCRLVS